MPSSTTSLPVLLTMLPVGSTVPPLTRAPFSALRPSEQDNEIDKQDRWFMEIERTGNSAGFARKLHLTDNTSSSPLDVAGD